MNLLSSRQQQRLLIFSLLYLIKLLAAATVIETLVISKGSSSADCYLQQDVFLVNGQIPGPPIYAEVGDLVEITVKNNLKDQAFSMHWHGIIHHKRPWNDGAPGVTEHPILPGSQRIYKFRVAYPGTYFYHSHTRFHAVSAHGSFIVTSPVDKQKLRYGRDIDIIFSEFFHTDVNKFLDHEEHMPPGVRLPVADSILVNGKTLAPLGKSKACEVPSNSTCNPSKCGQYRLKVKRGEIVRLRFINSGMRLDLRIKIPDHKVQIVEADGYLLGSGIPLENADLHVAQRYSAILRANRPPGTYECTVGVEGNPNLFTTFLLEYVDPVTAPVQVSGIYNFTAIDEKLLAWRPLQTTWFPRLPGRTVMFNVSFPNGNFAVNQKQWIPPPFGHHLLEMAYKNLSSVINQDNVYTLRRGEVVDMVIQLNGLCASHPWHMHGHAFWDMGGGPGSYNASSFQMLKYPILRDTVTIRGAKGSATNGDCGFRVIRLLAENIGAWHMHCHIHEHMARGMQVVLAVSLDRLDPVPEDLIKEVLAKPVIPANLDIKRVLM